MDDTKATTVRNDTKATKVLRLRMTATMVLRLIDNDSKEQY